MKTKLIFATLFACFGLTLTKAQNTSYQNPAPVGGTNNSAFGTNAINPTTSGSDNSASGYQALNQNSTGDNNTAHGSGALYSNITGNDNTAVGYGADVGSSGLNNATALGASAVVTANNSIQLGDANVTQIFGGTSTTAKFIVGGLQVTGGSPASGKILTSDASGNATWQSPSGGGGWSLTGDAGTTDGTNFIGTTDNVPFNFKVNGNKAGRIDHIKYNTFLGYSSGDATTPSTTGSNNTALGYQAFYSNTTGNYNIAIGSEALQNQTSGDDNIGIGTQALRGNSGNGNVGIGAQSMRQNMTGIYNVGVGYAALRGNLGGSSNVGVGNAALFTAGNSNYNTAIGDNAISATAGNSNTAVGYNTLASGGSGCTVLGFNANTSAGSISFGTAIGNGAIVNANNKIRLGDAAVTVVEGPVAYTTSDRRFKTNITEEDVKGLEFIKLLRPVVYNFDARKFTEFLTKNMPGTMAEKHLQTNFENATSIRQSGFIAQEVEEAAAKAGYNFNGLHKPNDENDNYSLAYAQFVVPLVKAVQEQQVMIEKLQEQLDANSQQKKSTDTGLTSPGNQLDGFALDQNIPNPFTHETLINYSIPSQINTAYLAVYDLSGKQVTTFDLDTKLSFINITSNNLAAGIYIYSIVADGKIMDSKRMVVADK